MSGVTRAGATINLMLTEQQTNVVLAGLGELKLGVSIETFNTIQMQIMQQRQIRPSDEVAPE